MSLKIAPGLLTATSLIVACGGRSDLDVETFVDVTAASPGAGGVAGSPAGSGGAAGSLAGKAGAGGGVAGTGGVGGVAAGQGGAGQGGAGQGGAGQGGAGQGGAGQAGAGAAGAPPQCTNDAQCDDGIGCTGDVCEAGVCVRVPRDVLCDDGLFCTGAETCDPNVGCVTQPVVCGDSVGCTDDLCDENLKGCVSVPNDALCPLSHKCGESEGCYALAYAHTPSSLYEVRLPSGKVTEIGPTGVQLTDVALVSNTQLYGLDFNALYLLDTTTAEAFFVASVDTSSMVAFDVAPDGGLYVGGGQGLYLLDPGTGVANPVATYPFGTQASGDIAFLQGRVLGTTRTQFGGSDSLSEFNLASGDAVVIGPTGFACVWGLAAFGETLYGLTCNGEVIRIDTNTGAGTLLSTGGPAFWGASAR